MSGIGAFVAATFAGLFVGTFFLGFLADRFGRKAIFTYALLGYSAASVVMACQTTSGGVLLWRFVAGVGIGIEIITIDAYITELVPSWMRGRAFAVNQAVMFDAVIKTPLMINNAGSASCENIMPNTAIAAAAPQMIHLRSNLSAKLAASSGAIG